MKAYDRDRVDQGEERVLRTTPVILEKSTAAVLIAVIAALAWMVLRAVFAEQLQVMPEPAEVLIVLALLTTSLLLVSVVALLHTRR
jgi:RsiW-degrading membrane proteinase PrsW (M82 family)